MKARSTSYYRTQLILVFQLQRKSYLTGKVHVCSVGKLKHVRLRARHEVGDVVDRAED